MVSFLNFSLMHMRAAVWIACISAWKTVLWLLSRIDAVPMRSVLEYIATPLPVFPSIWEPSVKIEMLERSGVDLSRSREMSNVLL